MTKVMPTMKQIYRLGEMLKEGVEVTAFDEAGEPKECRYKPPFSDPWIAREIGISSVTVQRIRSELYGHVTARGRQYPAGHGKAKGPPLRERVGSLEARVAALEDTLTKPTGLGGVKGGVAMGGVEGGLFSRPLQGRVVAQ